MVSGDIILANLNPHSVRFIKGLGLREEAELHEKTMSV